VRRPGLAHAALLCALAIDVRYTTTPTADMRGEGRRPKEPRRQQPTALERPIIAGWPGSARHKGREKTALLTDDFIFCNGYSETMIIEPPRTALISGTIPHQFVATNRGLHRRQTTAAGPKRQ